jgi:hypothetical protein
VRASAANDPTEMRGMAAPERTVVLPPRPQKPASRRAKLLGGAASIIAIAVAFAPCLPKLGRPAAPADPARPGLYAVRVAADALPIAWADIPSPKDSVWKRVSGPLAAAAPPWAPPPPAKEKRARNSPQTSGFARNKQNKSMDCNPRYTIDTDGLRLYNVECL